MDINADATATSLRPTGSWQETVDEILYGLHAVDRYSLAVVVGPNDEARRALAAELAARRPRRAIFREFRLEPGLLNPFEDFARAREWRDDYITLVYGLEGLSPSDLRKSLRLMNWNRGMLQRGNLRVVLWIPAQLEEVVLEHASDLVDWWTVYVALPEAPIVRAWDEPDIDPDEHLRALHRERDDRRLRDEKVEDLTATITTFKRSLRDRPTLAAGDVLGHRYRLLAVAGHGGFATVWKASDQLEKRLVAIKVLHSQWAQDRSRVERFMAGARRMTILRHPAIVPIIDGPVHEDGLYYLVMPWFAGGDLTQAVMNDTLDRPKALAALAQVARALAYAHAHGVVHRDIKPSNVLLDAHERGCLTDFDMAWAEDTTHGTRSGAGLGTFVYAAPEQMQDASRVDANADVYGLGMTILFVLLGRTPPPLVSMTQPELFEQMKCGEHLRHILRVAVAYDARDRAVTVDEIAAALDDEVGQSA